MSENNLERVSLKGQLLSPTLRQTAVLTHYFSFEDADQSPYASLLDDIRKESKCKQSDHKILTLSFL